MNVHTDAYDVYVGRAGRGMDGFFGNPFRLTSGESRGATLARFETYFLARVDRDSEFRRRVLDLRGKRLGCFCAQPGTQLVGDASPPICHGQIIARWVDSCVESTSPSNPRQPPASRRVAVVGSRAFSRLDLVESFLASLPGDAVVISGGARGVDQVAEACARRRGLTTLIHPADWDRHGRSAGFRRNALIVESSSEVHAFWTGVSRGTLDTMLRGHAAGLPVMVHREDGRVHPFPEPGPTLNGLASSHDFEPSSRRGALS